MKIRNKFPMGSATYQHIWTHSLTETLQYFSDLGLDVVEIMTCEPHAHPAALSQADRRQLRHILSRLGLKLAAINPSYGDLNLASALPEARKLAVDHVKENIQLAHDLECGIMIVVPGKRHFIGTPPFTNAWEWVLDSLYECLVMAEGLGITLAIEHVNLNFIQSADKLCNLIEQLNSPKAGILFDSGNANVLGDPIEYLEMVLPYLVHVHLDDNDGVNWLHAPVGTGNINFSGIIDLLDTHCYPGYIICEIWHPDNPLVALEDSLKYLQKL